MCLNYLPILREPHMIKLHIVNYSETVKSRSKTLLKNICNIVIYTRCLKRAHDTSFLARWGRIYRIYAPLCGMGKMGGSIQSLENAIRFPLSSGSPVSGELRNRMIHSFLFSHLLPLCSVTKTNSV